MLLGFSDKPGEQPLCKTDIVCSKCGSHNVRCQEYSGVTFVDLPVVDHKGKRTFYCVCEDCGYEGLLRGKEERK